MFLEADIGEAVAPKLVVMTVSMMGFSQWCRCQAEPLETGNTSVLDGHIDSAGATLGFTLEGITSLCGQSCLGTSLGSLALSCNPDNFSND